MSSSDFRLERTVELSPDTRALAERELRETPERVREALERLKELLKEHKDLYFGEDDELLTIFLRPCKWYPESAVALDKTKLASKRLGVLNRARQYLEPDHCLLLYKARVRPHLEYFCYLWAEAPQYQLLTLHRIQRRAPIIVEDPVWDFGMIYRQRYSRRTLIRGSSRKERIDYYLKKSGNAQVTPLGLRVCMGGGDHLLSGGPHAHLLFINL
ncbi:hypothetical protein EVAR_3279_1 [Eumeta japonica]|uniref:Uncharacterized protein n=1 Tax=Eumeta variegata TaxID=151549 RepID=A0A4C1SYF4_EUMVA|nr:hypothetical protein EVAR_3279_1 [Eumeta japonica]